ncbi:MAG: M6 family metalloprotease domain-containing protein, partial [Chitinivibrionales bacterium]|nr:M6 family metalloprotease domain-containing protein [Chitinivibrionales bacterium]
MSMRLIRQVSFLWIAFGYLLVSVSIDAAPYNGDIFYLKQPDGTRVAVAVWGDEFYQHVEDVNGYTLVRDDQYRICYAQVTRNGSKLTATDVVYRENGYATAITELQKRGISKGVEISPQAQYQARLDMIQLRSKYATSPLNKRGNGNPKLPKEVRGLTMCIDFSDCPATIPVAKIDSLANGSQFFEFGNNGSVYQYFKEVSAGKMEYKNIVVGYLRAPKPKSYYDDTATDGLKALELVRWAAQFTRDSLKIKFDSLTSDDSGYVYACNVYYAGNPDNGWAKGLWPHSWNLDTMVVSGIKKIFAYQMTNVGNDISIGTFVHENCHMVLNLPDLYSYYGTSRGVGRYCVMCANDKKNPQTLCAPFRGWMGWIDAIDISSVTAPTAYKCFSNTNQAYLYRNKKDSCEYFVIESRLRKGRSGMLLDQGLLIWHVDTNKARTGGNLPNLPWGNHLNQMKPDSHYLVSVEQANNLYNLEHNIGFGAYGDLYHARTSNRFNDYTTPSSHWWNDSLSGLTLTNISACGDTMDFAFGELPFSVTAPVSNDTLWANTAGFITWKSLDKSLLQVKIEISYDNGKTFSSLTSAIDNSG